MAGGNVFVLFLLFGGLAICFRVIAGIYDNTRVRTYIEERGGTLIEKHWKPFGRGWYGEKDSRIYQVVYSDAEGNIREAICKTSMLSGVYFTDDYVVQPSMNASSVPPMIRTEDDEVSKLKKENERLRQELREVRNQPLDG